MYYLQVQKDRPKQPRSLTRGFTLIELMVSVSIFAIVTLITSGSFIILADIYRKTQSNRAIIDNLNLAMDSMTLQIREGEGHNIEDNEISFSEYYINEDNEYISERDIRYLIEDRAGRGVLVQRVNGVSRDMTSSEIDLESLRFITSGSVPRRITVILEGVATNKEKLASEFLLQTTLSQRNYSGE